MLTGNYITYRSPQIELTVADIFREYWSEYKEKYPVTPQQAKVVGSVLACRTPALGGRIDQCQECGAVSEQLLVGGETAGHVCCDSCGSQRLDRILSPTSFLSGSIGIKRGHP